MSLQDQFRNKIQRQLSEKLRDLPSILGEEAVNFFKQSFEQEAFSGNHQQVWKKRKNPTKWGIPDPGHPLLRKTSHMYNDIRVTRINGPSSWVGTGVKYARPQNFGFRGVVSQHVSPFTRRLKGGGTAQVKGHTRVIHQNLPARQFIGNSPYLKARLNRVLAREINPILRQLNA